MLTPAGRHDKYRNAYAGTLYETDQILPGCTPVALDNLYYNDGLFNNSGLGRYVGRWLTSVDKKGIASISIAAGLLDKSANWEGAVSSSKLPKTIYRSHGKEYEDAA